MTSDPEQSAAMHAARTPVGCCGFAMAQAAYYRRFDLVEVQQTFYRPPRLDTLRRWREAAPPTGLRYFRLHGVGGYGHQYTDAELERLRGLCQGETWRLFNNRSMAADAQRFQWLLSS